MGGDGICDPAPCRACPACPDPQPTHLAPGLIQVCVSGLMVSTGRRIWPSPPFARFIRPVAAPSRDAWPRSIPIPVAPSGSG